MDETQIFKNRLLDLSRTCYEHGIYTYSDFLTLAEQSDFSDLTHTGRLYSNNYTLYGGYDGAERIIIRFGSIDELGFDQPWPISCIKFSPLNNKFAENVTHRDVLGSLMNLGIERHLLGDILIPSNKDSSVLAYVFAQEHIAQTICDELTRIKHTSVYGTIVNNPEDIPTPSLLDVNLQVKSERIDLIVAHVFNLSRSQAAKLFIDKKIYVNGRLSENESLVLKATDVVSVRSYGRFIYNGITGTTKKGNLNITISKYV